MMKLYKNKEWLFQQYIVENKTARLISKESGYNIKTILVWIHKFKLQKTVSELYTNKEWLYNEYVTLNKSTRDIAKEYGFGKTTINRWLLRHNIYKNHKSIQETHVRNTKKAFLDKYGVDNIFKNKDFIQKSFYNKYGVYNPSKLKYVRDKAKNTTLKKYGKEYYTQTKEYQIRSHNTKKKNETYGKSKQEDILHDLLKKKYPNIIRQYFDERYPFNCDFFIPELDLFIEYQGFWMHGKEPYNPNNISHLKIIDDYERQSKEINFKGKLKKSYSNAIEIWTKIDPLKRKYAKDNFLNYLEIWELKDIKIIIGLLKGGI